VKTPVFRFEAELLTDAPLEHIVGRLQRPGPQSFKCLRPLGTWAALEEVSGQWVLGWTRTIAGAEESGSLTLASDAKGAHLRLDGHMKGWAGFLLFGLLRWRTDRLLDRFVEEL